MYFWSSEGTFFFLYLYPSLMTLWTMYIKGKPNSHGLPWTTHNSGVDCSVTELNFACLFLQSPILWQENISRGRCGLPWGWMEGTGCMYCCIRMAVMMVQSCIFRISAKYLYIALLGQGWVRPTLGWSACIFSALPLGVYLDFSCYMLLHTSRGLYEGIFLPPLYLQT